MMETNATTERQARLTKLARDAWGGRRVEVMLRGERLVVIDSSTRRTLLDITHPEGDLVVKMFSSHWRRAHAYMEHECAGPKTVFTNADGRTCICRQCVGCFRRIGSAQGPSGDVHGIAIVAGDDDLSPHEMVKRQMRLEAYAQLLRLAECDLDTRLPDRNYPNVVALGEQDPLWRAVRSLRYQSYKERLRHPSWQLLKKGCFERARGRCEFPGCIRGGTLDLHHLHYDRLGHERPEDVRLVCREHHRKVHGYEDDRP